MGGSSTFNSRLAELKVKAIYEECPADLPVNDESILYVDMSVLLRIVHCRGTLGYESWVSNPSQIDQELIVKYVAELEPLLLCITSFTQICFVFEKGGSRNLEKIKERSSTLTKCLKNIYYAKKNTFLEASKERISKTVGLPSLQIQQAIGQALLELYQNATIHIASAKSDYLIFQMANQSTVAHQYVYSSDFDYLIYSPKITCLISTLKYTISRSDLMEKLELDTLPAVLRDSALLYAFGIAGCDDMATKIFGIGFKTAMDLILDSASVIRTLDDLQNTLLTYGKSEEVTDNIKILFREIEQHRAFLLEDPEELIQIPSIAQSFEKEFIFEEVKGERIRLQRLVTDDHGQILYQKLIGPTKNPIEGKPFGSKTKKRKQVERMQNTKIIKRHVHWEEESPTTQALEVEQEPVTPHDDQKTQQKKRKIRDTGRKKKQRKPNEVTEAKNKNKSLYMKTTKSMGGVEENLFEETKTVFQNQIVEDMILFKESNNHALFACNLELRKAFEGQEGELPLYKDLKLSDIAKLFEAYLTAFGENKGVPPIAKLEGQSRWREIESNLKSIISNRFIPMLTDWCELELSKPEYKCIGRKRRRKLAEIIARDIAGRKGTFN